MEDSGCAPPAAERWNAAGDSDSSASCVSAASNASTAPGRDALGRPTSRASSNAAAEVDRQSDIGSPPPDNASSQPGLDGSPCTVEDRDKKSAEPEEKEYQLPCAGFGTSASSSANATSCASHEGQCNREIDAESRATPGAQLIPEAGCAVMEGIATCDTSGWWSLSGRWRRRWVDEAASHFAWHAKGREAHREDHVYSGHYDGHFYMQAKLGAFKVKEQELRLYFTANTAGGFNVNGFNLNSYGRFTIIGLVAPDSSFKAVKIALRPPASPVMPQTGTCSAPSKSQSSTLFAQASKSQGPNVYRDVPAWQDKALQLVSCVSRLPDAVWFRKPVPKGLVFTNEKRTVVYSDVIQTPMDLETLKQNLLAGTYASLSSFVADARLIFKNAWSFNRVDSPCYLAADACCIQFENRLSQLTGVPIHQRAKDVAARQAHREAKTSPVASQFSDPARTDPPRDSTENRAPCATEQAREQAREQAKEQAEEQAKDVCDDVATDQLPQSPMHRVREAEADAEVCHNPAQLDMVEGMLMTQEPADTEVCHNPTQLDMAEDMLMTQEPADAEVCHNPTPLDMAEESEPQEDLQQLPEHTAVLEAYAEENKCEEDQCEEHICEEFTGDCGTQQLPAQSAEIEACRQDGEQGEAPEELSVPAKLEAANEEVEMKEGEEQPVAEPEQPLASGDFEVQPATTQDAPHSSPPSCRPQKRPPSGSPKKAAAPKKSKRLQQTEGKQEPSGAKASSNSKQSMKRPAPDDSHKTGKCKVPRTLATESQAAGGSFPDAVRDEASELRLQLQQTQAEVAELHKQLKMIANMHSNQKVRKSSSPQRPASGAAVVEKNSVKRKQARAQKMSPEERELLQRKLDLLDDDRLDLVFKFLKPELGKCGDDGVPEVNLNLDSLKPSRQHALLKFVEVQYKQAQAAGRVPLKQT